MTIDEQLHILTRGCDSIYSEKELRQKLDKSAETGKPLRAKLGLDPTAPDIHLGHTVVLGVILGYVYERTGSLVAPITMHLLFNLKTMIFATIANDYAPG